MMADKESHLLVGRLDVREFTIRSTTPDGQFVELLAEPVPPGDNL